MNNEILEAILSEIKDIKTDLSDVKVEVAKMDSVQKDLISVNTGISKINAKIEHEIDRAIKVLGEGQVGTQQKFDKLDKVENRVENLEHDMSAVKLKLKNA